MFVLGYHLVLIMKIITWFYLKRFILKFIGSYNDGSSPLRSSVLNRSRTDWTFLCGRYFFCMTLPLRPYLRYAFSSISFSSTVQNCFCRFRCFVGGGGDELCVSVRWFEPLGKFDLLLTGGGGAILALVPTDEATEDSEDSTSRTVLKLGCSLTTCTESSSLW